MINWVKVCFPTARPVFVDGNAIGPTNQEICVGEDGTYKFDLGEPRDYTPANLLESVSGRPRGRPLVIEFCPLDDGSD